MKMKPTKNELAGMVKRGLIDCGHIEGPSPRPAHLADLRNGGLMPRRTEWRWYILAGLAGVVAGLALGWYATEVFILVNEGMLK